MTTTCKVEYLILHLYNLPRIIQFSSFWCPGWSGSYGGIDNCSYFFCEAAEGVSLKFFAVVMSWLGTTGCAAISGVHFAGGSVEYDVSGSLEKQNNW